MNSLLSPSMMCADLFSMGETIAAFEKAGISFLHIDVMDGTFVPNYALGTDTCKMLRAKTSIPLDFHLMVTRPEEKLEYFQIQKGDIVSVHAESTVHLQRVLQRIRTLGAHPYVALNPATPLCVLDYILADIDGVLIMTVNPGYAGQKLIPACLPKIKELRRMLDERGYASVRIEVDGNVSFENARRMREAGADLFVAGSSGIFSPTGSLDDNIEKMKAAVI